MNCWVGSNAASVSPKSDVEAVTKAEAFVTANFRKPTCAAVEFFAVAALGHEQGAFAGEAMEGGEVLDFHKVGGSGHDKLEPGLRRVCEKFERGRMDAERCGHSGVREFGRQVELVHRLMERG